MAKFKIAQNPTFKADVDIPRVGGTFNKVSFEFKYRDRKELAKLFAGWQQSAKDYQDRLKEKGDDITLVDVTDADIEHQILQVSDLVVGWGFDDKFTPEAIRALVETSAGAADAIVKAYQNAFAAARLGN
ncbi:phage tail assembly chaperone [Pseudomonas abietaniphila]|uniref:Phage tail assembly chaperone n=1 Tax=Pseudomonas abietaniphila TaxID=89065 RepID=A0A1G8T9J9_9PSED|nr:phage tail assembly chaperone [Pseudomonas abietaniphila]SDJ38178.1 Phage tail assembly chaperone [Pseudomonas abietaniphila]